jgi:hypothetical protein
MMKPRNGNNRASCGRYCACGSWRSVMDWPSCDDGQLELFTAGELRAYFYNLSDSIKSLVLDQNPAIARRWKFCDDIPVWEFIEQIAAHRQARNSRLAGEIGLEPITTFGRKSAEKRNGRSFRPTVKRD